MYYISFRFGRHRLLQRRPSDSIVHMAIVGCTGGTVQLALFGTTAVSVSLISIFPDRKNLLLIRDRKLALQANFVIMIHQLRHDDPVRGWRNHRPPTAGGARPVAS